MCFNSGRHSLRIQISHFLPDIGMRMKNIVLRTRFFDSAHYQKDVTRIVAKLWKSFNVTLKQSDCRSIVFHIYVTIYVKEELPEELL